MNSHAPTATVIPNGAGDFFSSLSVLRAFAVPDGFAGRKVGLRI